MPLRLGEVLQAAAFLKFSWPSFFAWIAHTPAGAPLHYLVQLPLALAAPDSRIFLRLPSLLCAVGSAFLFFVLSKQVPLRFPILAMMLFVAVPTHLTYATQGRPYELGLFLLLVATLLFFSLLENPGFFKALIYAIVLAACLYTQPSCYLPAVGYLIALLGFANLKTYRRALWYALGATVVALAAFAPYFAWATVQRRGDWLVEEYPALAIKVAGVQAMMSMDPGSIPWYGIILTSLLLLGVVGGIWSTMPLAAYGEGAPPPPAALVKTRAIVFCLGGGVIVTLVGETAVSGWTALPFSPYQVLWALPGMIIVFCAGLDALIRLPALKSLALLSPVLTVAGIGLCVPGDIEYTRTQPVDLEKLTSLVRPQLGGDTCVVFVSERLSRYLFEVYDPDLGKYECQNFFHKRVVLAIHPFVRPEQEREARIYFRALDYEETHHDVLGDGKVIVLEAQH